MGVGGGSVGGRRGGWLCRMSNLRKAPVAVSHDSAGSTKTGLSGSINKIYRRMIHKTITNLKGF